MVNNRETFSPNERLSRLQDGLMGPFFISEFEVSQEKLDDVTEKIKQQGNVEKIVKSLVVELGMLSQRTDEEELYIERKIQNAFKYYTESYWKNYPARTGLNSDKLGELYDETENESEQSSLLWTIHQIREHNLENHDLVDAERVIRLLIVDEKSLSF